MRNAVPGFYVKIADNLDDCDEIHCETSAITRIYTADNTDLESVALYAAPLSGGPYGPVYERDPSDPASQIPVVIPITAGGNFAFPPSTYDTIFRKIVGTFGMLSEETVYATNKN